MAVAVVSPAARYVAARTAAAALLLRLLGEGALFRYFFVRNNKGRFFPRASRPVASGRVRSRPVASGRVVASGRLQSNSRD